MWLCGASMRYVLLPMIRNKASANSNCRRTEGKSLTARVAEEGTLEVNDQAAAGRRAPNWAGKPTTTILSGYQRRSRSISSGLYGPFKSLSLSQLHAVCASSRLGLRPVHPVQQCQSMQAMNPRKDEYAGCADTHYSKIPDSTKAQRFRPANVMPSASMVFYHPASTPWSDKHSEHTISTSLSILLCPKIPS